MTQPPAWKKAWKDYMLSTGRKNFSEFVGEAVNTFIENECAAARRKVSPLPERGKKGSGKHSPPKKTNAKKKGVSNAAK